MTFPAWGDVRFPLLCRCWRPPGRECCALPTALLSSHTGGLAGYTYRDLTEDMVGFADQWSALDIPFPLYTAVFGFSQTN